VATPLTPPQRSALADSAVLAGGRIVASAATAVIPIAIVRLLDQAEVGHYKQLFLISSTLVALLGLGIPASLSFFIPRHPGMAGRLLGQSTLILVVAGAVGGIAIVAARPLLERHFELTSLRAIVYVAAFTAVSVPVSLFPVAATADGRVGTASLAIAGFDMLRAAAMVVAALLVGRSDAVVAAAAVIALLQAAVYVAYLARRVPDDADARGPAFPVVARAQLAYALTYYGATVASVLRDQAHSYYVAASVAPDRFAIYAVGLAPVPLVSAIAQSLTDILIVRGSALHRERAFDALLEVWHRSLLNLAIIVVPIVAAVEVFAPELFGTLFGAPYLASVPVFRVWILLLLFQIPLLHGILRTLSLTRSATSAEVASLIVGLVTLPLFVRLWGPLGAVLSLAAGAIAFQVLGMRAVRSSFAAAAAYAFPWPALLRLSLVATTVALAVRLGVGGLPTVLRLMLGLPIALAGSFALALQAHVISDADRAQMIRAATRWLGVRRRPPPAQR
jgi:O-antigen/teichoic acid export membrane protein